MFSPIKTARLLLRYIEPTDAAALSSLMTPGISQWVASWPARLTPAMAATRITAELAQAQRGDAMPMAITTHETGAVIGWAVLHRDSLNHRVASLGFWMGEEQQGRGYIKEAVTALLACAFNHFDVDTVEAGAQTTNAASIAILRGCGMAPAGERLVFAPIRGREELCAFFALNRAG